MENFSLIVRDLRRSSNLFVPVSHLGYRKEDCSLNPNPRRQTVNFGVVLSSPTGRTGYRINGREFECTVPAFIFTCPGPEYSIPDPSTPLEKFFFSYSPETLPFFRFFSAPERVLMPFRGDFNLPELLDEIHRHCRTIRHPGEADRLDAVCMRLVQEIQLSAASGEQHGESGEESVYPIASYLDLHFAENPDLKALVRKHGMSYRTFLRRWKSVFPDPPAVCIRKRKLEEACRLLAETNLKIYEIAARTGFRDPYYFIRFFHAEMHLSPTRYRKLSGRAET